MFGVPGFLVGPFTKKNKFSYKKPSLAIVFVQNTKSGMADCSQALTLALVQTLTQTLILTQTLAQTLTLTQAQTMTLTQTLTQAQTQTLTLTLT